MLYSIGQGYDAPINNMFDEDGRDASQIWFRRAGEFGRAAGGSSGRRG